MGKDAGCRAYCSDIFTGTVEISDEIHKLVAFLEIFRSDFTAGEYERSAAAFQQMGDYKDSKARVFLSAVELYKARRYEEALPYFVWLDGYIDNGYYLQKCQECLSAQNADASGQK